MILSHEEAAQAYLDLGWSVIPIKEGTKQPYIKWIKYQKKLPTRPEVHKWFTKWPTAGIGLINGPLSGTMAIDFDSPKALEAWAFTVDDLPETIALKTGRKGGGWQYMFKWPGEPVKNIVNILEEVDVRGASGLTILPPSLHKSGKVYQWNGIDPIEDGLDDLADLPAPALDFIKAYKKKTKEEKIKNPEGWVEVALLGVTKPGRNDMATKLAGWYVGKDFTEAETYDLLQGWNKRNDPPLEDIEIKNCVESIARRHGTVKLSKHMEHTVYNLEIIKYPDGVTKFMFYAEGQDDSVEMSADDIVSVSKFRAKYLELTHHIIPPIKNENWFPLIQGAIDEAPVIKRHEDETKIGAVKRVLQLGVSAETETPETYIDNSIVLYQGTVYFLMDWLLRVMMSTGSRLKNHHEGSKIARTLGFKTKAVRFKTDVIRCWCMEHDAFTARMAGSGGEGSS